MLTARWLYLRIWLWVFWRLHIRCGFCARPVRRWKVVFGGHEGCAIVHLSETFSVAGKRLKERLIEHIERRVAERGNGTPPP